MQTSVRLPQHLYERLTEAAGEKGIGAEIRERLERSFNEDVPVGLDGDATTRKLLAALAKIARVIEDGYGPWHRDRFTAEVFGGTAGYLARQACADLPDTIDTPRAKPPKPGSVLAKLFAYPAFKETFKDREPTLPLLISTMALVVEAVDLQP